MNLFIANTTKQFHEFWFRVPENEKLQNRRIEPGSQIKIPELSQEAIDAIVSQHAQYGMRSAKDLKKETEFAGLIYSVDKPVPGATIAEGIERNDAVLVKQGTDTRAAAALANNEQMREIGRQGNAQLAGSEVEIIEQNDKPGSKDDAFKQRIEVESGDGRKVKRGR